LTSSASPRRRLRATSLARTSGGRYCVGNPGARDLPYTHPDVYSGRVGGY